MSARVVRNSALIFSDNGGSCDLGAAEPSNLDAARLTGLVQARLDLVSTMHRAAAALLAVLAAGGAISAPAAPECASTHRTAYGAFPALELRHCSSSWDLGAAMGQAFAPLIRERLGASPAMKHINVRRLGRGGAAASPPHPRRPWLPPTQLRGALAPAAGVRRHARGGCRGVRPARAARAPLPGLLR